MAFNLDDYEPVASRIRRFWDDHPNGAIHSELVFDDGHRCIVKATVYLDRTDSIPVATDYAEELLTDRGVNSTSRIENCATSAQGRALAAAGYLPSDWSKKPSREEMAKVQRLTPNTPPPTSNGPRMVQGIDQRMPSVTVTQPAGGASDKQIGFAKSLLKKGGFEYPANLETMDKRDMTALIDQLKNGTYIPPQPLETEEPF